MQNDPNKKYPVSLFIIGFLMNLVKKFFLFFPGLILLIVGIWVDWCLVLGLVLFLVNVLISFVEQIQLRNTTVNSDDSNFKEWQDAILSSDWKENIQNLVEEQMDMAESFEEDE